MIYHPLGIPANAPPLELRCVCDCYFLGGKQYRCQNNCILAQCTDIDSNEHKVLRFFLWKRQLQIYMYVPGVLLSRNIHPSLMVVVCAGKTKHGKKESIVVVVVVVFVLNSKNKE